MTNQIYRTVSLVLAAVFLLAACAPAAPTAAPASQVDVSQQVAVAVAATLSAMQDATAAAQAAATSTPEPAQPTATSALPTATPFVIATGTSFSTSGGGSSTTPTYACDIIRQRPFDNAVFKPGDSFDIKWTILNTGTATWAAGKDLRYFSGPKLTTAGAVELPKMEPGDQFSVAFDAKAPEKPGYYVMAWKLEGGFCFPYVAITVVKPPDP